MVHKLFVISFLFLFVTAFAQVDTMMQTNHRALIEQGKDSWLLKGEHSFMVIPSFDSKTEDSVGSVYYMKNAFSFYRKFLGQEIHTKAICTPEPDSLLIDIVHQCKTVAISYSVRIGTKEDTLNVETSHEQKENILNVLMKQSSLLHQAAKAYNAKQAQEDCLMLISILAGTRIDSIASDQNGRGSWNSDTLSHGWEFNCDWKGPSSKTFAADVKITLMNIVIYDNRMSGEVAANGVGTNQSIIVLTNWKHPVPADPRYWYIRGGTIIYYTK